MVKNKALPEQVVKKTSVDEFLAKVDSMSLKNSSEKRGRLMFALDATASRQPTWDTASHIQAEMFHATTSLGILDMQLVFFGGFEKFNVSKWINHTSILTQLMGKVSCQAGRTQIRKVLQHAVNETLEKKVDALVFIGDSCEEDIDAIGAVAGKLGLLRVPVFIFHEGEDPIAEYCFREIAKLSGGAYCPFNDLSRERLKTLLCAVAIYAVGGKIPLKHFANEKSEEVLSLIEQMK